MIKRIFAVIILAVSSQGVFAQSAKDFYEKAKAALEEGDASACLANTERAIALLNGTNVRIEALRCQCYAESQDWVNARIAYRAYEQLGRGLSGEAYRQMKELGEEIDRRLRVLVQSRKQEVDNMKRANLSIAQRESAQLDESIAQNAQQLSAQNEERIYKAVVNSRDEDLLRLYLEQGGNKYKDDVGRELNKKARPSGYIMSAVKKNGVEEVRYLLGLGADVNHKESGASLLHAAVELSGTTVLELLVASKPNLEVYNERGETPLLSAVRLNRHRAVELLAKSGASVTAEDSKGNTPASYCISSGNGTILKTLLTYGLEVNRLIKYQAHEVTPLFASVYFKQDLVLTELLLQHGANPDLSCQDGWTPLTAAAYKKNQDMVKLLLNRNAGIDVQGVHGWTALHFAARNRDNPMVAILVRQGASQTVQDTWRRTPVNVARERRFEEVIKSLKQY